MTSDNIEIQPPAQAETIAPTPFRISKGMRPKPPWRSWKALSLAILAIVLIVLMTGVWFVFTARQVRIDITPFPAQVSIRGGLFTPSLGEYHLLRPGNYTVEVQKPCYAPLAAPLTVTAAKGQTVAYQMEMLPGKVSIWAHDKEDSLRKPIDAQVSIDGQVIGTASLEDLEIPAGNRYLEVRADNYQTFEQTVHIDGCNKPQEFVAALLPGWADLSISSMPSGATITVDGRTAGQTPLTLPLMAGTHKVVLNAKGFKPWQTQLSVQANQPIRLDDVRLQPADGRLVLNTNPAGANVMIGETFAGQTPLKIDLTSTVKHQVHISKAGYAKATRTVAFKPEEQKTIRVRLKPVKGVIRFKVSPRDAALFVNGSAMGPVPSQLSLLAVPQTIELRKPGYATSRSTLTPRPGLVQQVDVILKPAASAKSGPKDTATAGNGYKLKLVRPQNFVMGASRREQGRRSNETLRTIELTRLFYMGAREVTNKEFRAFESGHRSGTFNNHSLNRDGQPVAQVTWDQAARFCNWLSKQDGLPPAYVSRGEKMVAANPPTTGYRLPTEAEWEYCARYVDGRSWLKYPWGGQFPPTGKAGNFADQSAKGLFSSLIQGYDDGFPVSAPPGRFSGNAMGLFDMGGNVAEWCHDYYSIYAYDAKKVYTDPVGPSQGRLRVVRGSSYKDGTISALRLAYRDYSEEGRVDLGFRISRYVRP